MEQLTAPVIMALNQAGLHAVAALPATPAPRLKQAACGVSLAKAEGCDVGLYQYLGLEKDAERGEREIYGKRLQAELCLTIYSPTAQGGSGCMAAVGKAADVLLSGITPLNIGDFRVGTCSYDQNGDCFVCTLTAHVSAMAYATLEEGGILFTDFTLKGDML